MGPWLWLWLVVVLTVLLDVTSSASIAAATAWVRERVGDQGRTGGHGWGWGHGKGSVALCHPIPSPGLWGLVNNAGIFHPVGPNEWLSKDDFVKVLNVNLVGLVEVTLSFLPLVRRARGRVVNVASMVGRIALVGGGYCPSKYGVEAFSDSLRYPQSQPPVPLPAPIPAALRSLLPSRRELLDFGVKVSIVEPGCFGTDILASAEAKQSIVRVWDRAPSQVKQEYGQQYFQAYNSNFQHFITTANPKLSLVTNAMEHALTAEYPRTRYGTGGHGWGWGHGKGSVALCHPIPSPGLWGLVNNAGIAIPTAPNEWLSKDDFVKVLNVNLVGLVEVTLSFLPLVRRARGRVVNVASVMGRIAFFGGGYCPSKYGVEAFSDSLRLEMRHFGVKVSIIEPGYFKTAITSAENLEKCFLSTWEKVSDETKAGYGEDYLKDFLAGAKKMHKRCNSNLSLVTDCMEHALTSRYPRARYSAGWDAKLLYIPLSYLPSALADRQTVPGLSEKFVLITGCDSGFGSLLARQLDARGLRVLAGCLTEPGAATLRAATSQRLQTILLDVTSSASIAAATAWVRERVGDQGRTGGHGWGWGHGKGSVALCHPIPSPGLWGLVNNAGIAIPSAPNEWLSKDDFVKVLNVNLVGLIEVTLSFLPLVRRARGRVVNVASVMGRIAFFGGGYCPSKYGVEAFSDTLRREMHPFGVQISIIEPGGFQTGMTDPAVLVKALQHLWERLPAETQAAYGPHYLETYARYMALLHRLSSSRLCIVTDCMEHALLARCPRSRYTAGWDARLTFLPLSYCPAWLSDTISAFFLPIPARGTPARP
ncbi:Retinol dehydrogenase 16 [Aix galericulata]|nr:Retinol dehydrogenase 16 [Aix galericulata]